MTRNFGYSLLILSASAVAMMPKIAYAEKQTPPLGSAPKAFILPAPQTYALPNGMRVTLAPYGKIPKVTMSLVLLGGGIDEPPGELGVAELTNELLKQGTTTLNAKEIAEAAAQMGSTLTVTAQADETVATMDVLSESGPAAVKLLADVIQHPRLPESELARLKQDRLREIAVAKAQPAQIALSRFRKLMYADHPYGSVLPTEETVDKLTIADVKSFYAANFGAARAHLYVAGNFDTEGLKAVISSSFSGWATGSPAVVNAPAQLTQKLVEIIDRPGAPQSTLYLGLPVADPTSPDSVRLIVSNALLGGSFFSRITKNIREQKGYTYSPRSQISSRYHDSYWVEIADVTTKDTGASLREIFSEILRLQKEAPTADELQGIQRYLSGIFVIQNSTRQALIGQLQFVDLQRLGEDYLTTYVQRVNAVTAPEVSATTAKYIRPDSMTLVVVGDQAKIAEQLAPFALK